MYRSGRTEVVRTMYRNGHNNNNNLFNQRLTDRRLVYTTASHRYERCWSGASRLPTARSSLQAAYTAPVVHLSQPKLVPTLLLGGQGYMCVNNLHKVVTRYASVGDRTRDLPIASRER